MAWDQEYTLSGDRHPAARSSRPGYSDLGYSFREEHYAIPSKDILGRRLKSVLHRVEHRVPAGSGNLVRDL